MHVKELIARLQELEPELEIRVAVRKGWRPVGKMKEIKEISIVYDQDTNKPSYYFDVDIEDV